MYNKKIFTIVVLCTIMTLISSSWVRNIQSQEELTKGFQENHKKVWVIQKGQDLNNKVFENVAEVFRGLIQFATLKSSGANSLEVIGDNREQAKHFEGQFTTEDIVKFVLASVDEVVAARGQVAKALKANQQFHKKESERANKEWEEEENLRKKSQTFILNAENWSTFLNGRQPWVINFYESNCSACIELNKQWEAITTQFKGKAKIAKINMTEAGNQALQQQIKLSKYPSVRFFKNGLKKVTQFTQFEGVHRRFSLREWINSKLDEKSTQVQIPQLNKPNYQTLCKSSKNTCIIVFLEDSDSSSLQKISQLSLKHIKKPITFLVAKKDSQRQFAEQVQISSYPQTLMIYCKQKKLYKMGGFDVNAVNDSIEEISMGNRNGWVKYKFDEKLQ